LVEASRPDGFFVLYLARQPVDSYNERVGSAGDMGRLLNDAINKIASSATAKTEDHATRCDGSGVFGSGSHHDMHSGQ